MNIRMVICVALLSSMSCSHATTPETPTLPDQQKTSINQQEQDEEAHVDTSLLNKSDNRKSSRQACACWLCCGFSTTAITTVTLVLMAHYGLFDNINIPSNIWLWFRVN